MHCSVCFESYFVEIHGILTCQACGTQTQALDDCCVQAVLEEAEVAEDGGAALHSRYRSGMVKSVRQMREVAKQAAAPPEITDAEILAGAKLVARVYLVCLQELLRAQVEVLVKSFGLPPELRSIARHLWLSYLPHTALLDFDPRTMPEAARLFVQDGDGRWQEERNTTRGSILSASFSTTSIANAEALPSMDLRGWHAAMHAEATAAFILRKALPPASTLAVCFLGCTILRHPTDPWDLVRWALDGGLPYLDLYQRSIAAGLLAPAFDTARAGIDETDLLRLRCSEQLLSLPSTIPNMRCGFWPLLLGNARGLPSAQSLGLYTLALSTRLRVRLPDVPAELLLMRYARELRLPQAVALVACELLKMYLMASPALSLAGLARSSDPYVNLLALIYLATKLCYGLDGGAHPRLPHVPPMPCSWPAWADALGRVWGHTTQFPLTPEQVCGLSSEQQVQYLRYVAELLLSHERGISSVQDIVAQLAAMAQAGTGEHPAGPSSSSSSSRGAALVPAFGAPQPPKPVPEDDRAEAAQTGRDASASGQATSAGGASAQAAHRYARAVAPSGLTHVDSLAVLTVCCLRCGVHHEMMLNVVEALEEAMALCERVLVLEERFLQHALGAERGASGSAGAGPHTERHFPRVGGRRGRQRGVACSAERGAGADGGGLAAAAADEGEEEDAMDVAQRPTRGTPEPHGGAAAGAGSTYVGAYG